jgi:hypothetical protein
MSHEQFEHQSAANTMENEMFELKNVVNTVEMAVSNSRLLQIIPISLHILFEVCLSCVIRDHDDHVGFAHAAIHTH